MNKPFIWKISRLKNPATSTRPLSPPFPTHLPQPLELTVSPRSPPSLIGKSRRIPRSERAGQDPRDSGHRSHAHLSCKLAL